METTPPIKKEGPELDIQGTPTTKVSDHTLSDTVCQTANLNTKDCDSTDHPYYQLGQLIEEAQCMLLVLGGRRRHRRKTVIKFIDRIVHLMPWISARVRGGTQGRLSRVLLELHVAVEVLEDSSLTPKAAAEKTDQMLEEARRILRDLIVADEDAKFPGWRKEEGELILEDRGREAMEEEGV